MFQPCLEVTSPDGGDIFAGRGEAAGVVNDSAINQDQAERARLDMTYRGRVEFARVTLFRWWPNRQRPIRHAQTGSPLPICRRTKCNGRRLRVRPTDRSLMGWSPT